jgi:hypothetical protein
MSESDPVDRERAALERRLRRRATANPLREQMLAFIEEHGTDKSVKELRSEISTDESMSELVVEARRES